MTHFQRKASKSTKLAIALAMAATEAGHASVLQEVLFRIDLMGTSPLSSIMVNLAENIAMPIQTARGLQNEDLVIVGYGSDGLAITLQSGESGLIIPPELAASMSNGLHAGIYPVGSQLYLLPPAGQLSLYEQTREGEVLSQAQALLMSRIDGSINTVITGIAFPELAPAQLASVYDAHGEADILNLATISSTVLGAVNTGEIVTNVTAHWQPAALAPRVDLQLAEVSMGASVSLSEALTGGVASSSLTLKALGGTAQGPALALNQATNGTAIAGQIRTIVFQQTVSVGEIMSTAIGAVNAGTVNPLARP